MKYEELLYRLNQIRICAQRLSFLQAREEESLEVSQRLTATYGRERVKSSPSYENPALKMMILAEKRKDACMHETLEAQEALNDGQELIMTLPVGLHRDILIDYYVYGWSYGKICRLRNWNSPRTAQRNISKAVNKLFEALK